MPGGLPGTSEKSSEPEASEETAQSAADSQEALVGQFKETLGSVLLAQQYLAMAFDQADQADDLGVVIKSLQGECGTKCMKRSIKISEAANKSIGKALESETVISSEGKTNYLLALPPYIKGTLSAKDLLTEAKNWGKQATGEIKSAGMMNAPKIKKKLDAGMYVVQQTPKLVKNWAKATKQITTYAKASNIDLSSIKGANTDIFSD
jgi:hypothetical protein